MRKFFSAILLVPWLAFGQANVVVDEAAFQPAAANLTNWAELATNVLGSLPYQAPLPAGTDGQFLTLSGALPAWAYPTNLPSLNITDNLTVGTSVYSPGLWIDSDLNSGMGKFGGSSRTGLKHDGYALVWSANTFGEMTVRYGLGFSATDWADPDLRLYRDAANILAQRNGTAAQTERVYGTYTDGSNGKWLESGHDGTVAYIAAKAQGTGGTDATLELRPQNAGLVEIEGSASVATNLTVGGTIYSTNGVYGNKLYLEADLDTYIYAASANRIHLVSANADAGKYIPGIGWYFKERLSLDQSGTAGIKADSAGVVGVLNSTGTSGTGSLVASNVTANGYFQAGTQPGIAATIDTLVAGGTTNRLVFVGGILVSNITNYAP